jgi:hypothetical protein
MKRLRTAPLRCGGFANRRTQNIDKKMGLRHRRRSALAQFERNTVDLGEEE